MPVPTSSDGGTDYSVDPEGSPAQTHTSNDEKDLVAPDFYLSSNGWPKIGAMTNRPFTRGEHFEGIVPYRQSDDALGGEDWSGVRFQLPGSSAGKQVETWTQSCSRQLLQIARETMQKWKKKSRQMKDAPTQEQTGATDQSHRDVRTDAGQIDQTQTEVLQKEVSPLRQFMVDIKQKSHFLRDHVSDLVEKVPQSHHGLLIERSMCSRHTNCDRYFNWGCAQVVTTQALIASAEHESSLVDLYHALTLNATEGCLTEDNQIPDDTLQGWKSAVGTDGAGMIQILSSVYSSGCRLRAILAQFPCEEGQLFDEFVQNKGGDDGRYRGIDFEEDMKCLSDALKDCRLTDLRDKEPEFPPREGAIIMITDYPYDLGNAIRDHVLRLSHPEAGTAPGPDLDTLHAAMAHLVEIEQGARMTRSQLDKALGKLEETMPTIEDIWSAGKLACVLQDHAGRRSKLTSAIAELDRRFRERKEPFVDDAWGAALPKTGDPSRQTPPEHLDVYAKRFGELLKHGFAPFHKYNKTLDNLFDGNASWDSADTASQGDDGASDRVQSLLGSRKETQRINNEGTVHEPHPLSDADQGIKDLISADPIWSRFLELEPLFRAEGVTGFPENVTSAAESLSGIGGRKRKPEESPRSDDDPGSVVKKSRLGAENDTR
ncbi:hypothetical protein DB88DRAFT_547963 [Papiliotrema laurentii]|uniref:Uncharacterized protein n=1 Tax=Papiliotrema laurentii TaxID=5418 RepID=A0AAD9FNJ5_PAPLA|nr:hypothetical protein DB88DRAFT_547963 [Papiliotrema laurentii]